MNYVLNILIFFEIYLILSLSLNVMLGYSGIVSLAHAAFYGIGAYVFSLLSVIFGIYYFPCIILGVMVSVILSYLISLASLKFKGDYFILVTLAFQIIVFSILYNWTKVTNGPYGISNIKRPELLGLNTNTLTGFSIYSTVITSIVIIFLTVILKSPFGRVLRAIRDNELAAISLGKNNIRFKMISVAAASGCAAIAGTIYASYITFIDPTSFTSNESILLLSMVIIGGSGNIKGSVIGALTLVIIPELLRFVSIPDSIAANLRMIIYGLLLIFLMILRPQGILGEYKFK